MLVAVKPRYQSRYYALSPKSKSIIPDQLRQVNLNDNGRQRMVWYDAVEKGDARYGGYQTCPNKLDARILEIERRFAFAPLLMLSDTIYHVPREDRLRDRNPSAKSRMEEDISKVRHFTDLPVNAHSVVWMLKAS